VNHDIVAIGGSAGAVDVLLNMVGDLPSDLAASVFVVVHTSPEHISILPDLLTAKGPLRASHPVHDEKILPGRIYVAPPDAHLMLRPGSMAVVRGPRENGHRPAVDTLFRSASAAYGPQVIGVVLSGYQDCGTAGMMSIKARGGLGIVQSPDTALAAEMPGSVIAKVAVDHVVHPIELPGLLARLVRTTAKQVALEPDARIKQLEGDERGSAVELACPSCQGVLTEAELADFHFFRCHVGHTFTLGGLVREQSEEMERALWAAVRALEEGAALSRRLAAHEKNVSLRKRFLEKDGTQTQQADLIRQMLLRGARLTSGDSTEVSAAAAAGPAPR
jgi:two-component system, chemotaxis family, protein-glutamate methylesterase/glutaminase